MSMPTEDQLKWLRKYKDDQTRFQLEYDMVLEKRLTELDPEWMRAMDSIYVKSGHDRWSEHQCWYD